MEREPKTISFDACGLAKSFYA